MLRCFVFKSLYKFNILFAQLIQGSAYYDQTAKNVVKQKAYHNYLIVVINLTFLNWISKQAKTCFPQRKLLAKNILF